MTGVFVRSSSVQCDDLFVPDLLSGKHSGVRGAPATHLALVSAGGDAVLDRGVEVLMQCPNSGVDRFPEHAQHLHALLLVEGQHPVVEGSPSPPSGTPRPRKLPSGRRTPLSPLPTTQSPTSRNAARGPRLVRRGPRCLRLRCAGADPGRVRQPALQIRRSARKIPACGTSARPESARNRRNRQKTENETNRFSYPPELPATIS